MAIYYPTDEDCSIPYKTFNDLKDNDEVFVINPKDLTTKNHIIFGYEKFENKISISMKNCYTVRFMLRDSEPILHEILNGNMFISGIHINYELFYVVTDKRICNTILSMMEFRNKCQWGQIMSAFGNPLERYAEKSIPLG